MKEKEINYNIDESIKDEVEDILLTIYQNIGIDIPENHKKIIEFVVDDIKTSTTEKDFTSEDVRIGFRRFIENSNKEN